MREFNSGQNWCRLKKIVILDPKGWESVNDFNHNLIDYEEFLNRAASSKPKMANAPSRREAAKMLRKF
jgi:hypothetical protein